MIVVIAMGGAAYYAIVEDMDRGVGDGVKHNHTGWNDVDAEQPLDDEETEVHHHIVQGFQKELDASVDGLVVIVVKEDMEIQIGDRARCGKQMNGTMNKVDPAIGDEQA